jgi:hypothetical protein
VIGGKLKWELLGDCRQDGRGAARLGGNWKGSC